MLGLPHVAWVGIYLLHAARAAHKGRVVHWRLEAVRRHNASTSDFPSKASIRFIKYGAVEGVPRQRKGNSVPFTMHDSSGSWVSSQGMKYNLTDNRADGLALLAEEPVHERHKVWEPEWWRLKYRHVYLCSVVLFAAGILCSAGGIGGGGIYVTVLMVAGQLSVHDAVPLSKAIVFLGSISSLVLNLLKTTRDKSQNGPTLTTGLIDYSICRIVVPSALLGTYGGVIFNRILPSSVILFVLTAVLMVITVMVTRNAVMQYREDRALDTHEGGKLPVLQEQEQDKKRIAQSDSLQEEYSDTAEIIARRRQGTVLDVSWSVLLVVLVVSCGVLNYHANECRSALEGGLGNDVCKHPAVFFAHHVLIRAMDDEVSADRVLLACNLIPVVACLASLTAALFKGCQYEGWHVGNGTGFAVMAVATGALAGLVGIGGGLIFSPFFLLMGVEPAIAVATSSTCVIFTASSTSLQYIATDRVIMSLTIVYGIINLIASYAGTKFVHWLQDTVHAQRSYITGIVAVGVSISAILSAIKLLDGEELH